MWEAIETQRPSAWRVVFKGLTLLEHLVKNGSERCVDDARNHSHVLRNLNRFNYYEGTVDRGVGVREKSKQLIEILSSDDNIREERQNARKMREKFSGSSMTASSGGGGGGGGGGYSGYGNDDSQWQSGGGSSGGRYGDDRGVSGSKGYGGRYGDSGIDSTEPAPTFAAIPDEPSLPKKVKKKKKKKKAVADAADPDPAPGKSVCAD
jgi:epsin